MVWDEVVMFVFCFQHRLRLAPVEVVGCGGGRRGGDWGKGRQRTNGRTDTPPSSLTSRCHYCAHSTGAARPLNTKTELSLLCQLRMGSQSTGDLARGRARGSSVKVARGQQAAR